VKSKTARPGAAVTAVLGAFVTARPSYAEDGLTFPATFDVFIPKRLSGGIVVAQLLRFESMDEAIQTLFECCLRAGLPPRFLAVPRKAKPKAREPRAKPIEGGKVTAPDPEAAARAKREASYRGRNKKPP
jgi:hypothetical protein